MNTPASLETGWFTPKGLILVPRRLRKQYQIEDGTKVVFEPTPEGILVKPVNRHSINRLRGILKRPAGGKTFAQEWAEHKRAERKLEDR
jgi:bifunctional DNA-binding transcriptional regulator/antitoxin component of YhaV-PrlF toxin-antitoxin module